VTTYFLDSSALIKNYVIETGSAYIKSVISPTTGNAIAIAHITLAEVTAGLASKVRGQFLSQIDFEKAVKNILDDTSKKFLIGAIDQRAIQLAVALIRRHPLRGYDAVQLASGLLLNEAIVAAAEQPLVFVTADKSLLAAAQAENLQTEDPNNHP